MKAKLADTAAYRRMMRVLGYNDGVAGRPASRPDAEYQASWRRGRDTRANLRGS